MSQPFASSKLTDDKHTSDVVEAPGFSDDTTTPVLSKESVDPVYQAKAHVLNNAIQDIGMGKYQWELCDIFGRRLAFNLTIGITAVFGLIAAGSPNFAAIGCFAAFWSVGVGGNLPVDSAVFLEFLPGSHQYLLTVLSIFWALAQLLATLVAWPLLGYHTCETTDTTCSKSDNFGWRWFMIAMGGFAMIMFICRFVFFTLYESPKYLMGKGRDDDAVRIVHEVARRNGKDSALTLADLEAHNLGDSHQGVDAAAALRRKLEKVNLSHVRALFATPKLAFSTAVIMCVWAFIGLGFPLYNAFLPYIQATRGADFGDGSTYITYRNSCIIAVLGVPGALLGGVLVETPYIGRKGALAMSTVLTGVFLFASTTALTSDALLGWNCAYNLMSNVMYAVLYAYTPEVFPTKDRGTGNALTACANRVFGIMAPIIAIYADLNTSAPVYVSGALFLVAGMLVLVLPFESRGKASL
ncbi:MAG: hypothetical protein LQ351_003844 [Letrouitia transgressa]|nr:MAG: hypothetical protein LQ351_003844 [Letrouitia transgressa]